ncbi:acetyl-CoA synthetase-like protein [Dentipellis sp. KUC8613]|nr:acetyl-CoA synthetase-like protein [Dentipellis sp. KUC8613]
MPHVKSLYPPIPDPPVFNFYEWLTGYDAANNPSDFTLFIDGLTGQKRGKREFFKRVADCATAFLATSDDGGLEITKKPGEMVGIFSENSLEYPTIVFSLLKLAVPFALLPAYSFPTELASLMKLSGITRLFISPTLLSVALKAAQEADFPRDKIYVLQGSIRDMRSLDDMIQNVRVKGTPSASARAVSQDHLAYLSFSSGTTGLPKAVMISHKNLYYSTMQPVVYLSELAKSSTAAARGPQANYICLASMPYYHVAAFHFCMLRCFMPPSTMIILPRWDMEKVLELVGRYRVTHLGSVPSMTVQLISSPKFYEADFSSVISYSTGAAHLPLEHRKKVLTRLPNVKALASIYGMTECSVVGLQIPLPGLFPGRFSDEALSSMTGILPPGVEARIVREDGSDADFDEVGELYLRGGNVTLGYWGNQEATKETFLPDSWLRTGDRFTVDRNGAFFYVDRLKDTLKISGVQVSPLEIEETLLRHPDKLIADATVAGVPGERFSDEKVPRAWVVLSDAGRRRGTAAVIAALHEWSHTQMPRHKALRGGIEVIDQIPKSPSGKVLRRVLQEKYEKDSKASPHVPAKL